MTLDSVMYFKQYGAQRTGTNYLKRLVELNFKNVTVFGSVLGWKHGMFETGNGYQHKCDSHKQWVDDKTKYGDVYSVDQHRLKYTPQELHDACERLNYLISIKNPYAFVCSYKNFRAKKQPWNESKVIDWLKNYLDCYSRWKDLYNNNSGCSILVDYDDLICNRNIVLAKIQTKFKLEKKHEEFVQESKTVKASTDHGLLISKEKFDTDYYSERRYMDEIPDGIERLITSFLKDYSGLRC